MIQTGKKPIGIMTYLAIMSVCFIINLPGVAVAPMEGRLKLLLHSPELEVQLLTTLPNFLIIPFVIIAGKLSTGRHKFPLIVGALALYLACGIIYLFVDNIKWLILISCFLGAAAGILIPFAMGFVTNTFSGKYRTRQLGLKSSISNFAVVLASFVVGVLIETDNWHLPFVVYLVVAIPLVLSPWLRNVPGVGDIPLSLPSGATEADIKVNMSGKKIWAMMGVDFLVSFVAISIVNYMPQLVEGYQWSPETSGTIAALFFFCTIITGVTLVFFVRSFRNYTFFIAAFFILIGVAMFTFIPHKWAFYIGAAFGGMGFGISQPLIYDKTTYAIYNPAKTILGLSYVLTALYLAIATEPFIISGLNSLFHTDNENLFAFSFSFYTGIVYLLITLIFRKKFAFAITESYFT